MKGARGCGLDFPKERQWPSGSGSDAMQSNGAARKIYKNTNAHTYTQTRANTGSRWTHMQHGRSRRGRRSVVGCRGSGNRGHRTLDIGNLQRTRKSCQWGAGHQEPAAGIPGPQDLFFLFSCKQSSVQLRRLSLLASAATASAERDSPLRPATHQPPSDHVFAFVLPR